MKGYIYMKRLLIVIDMQNDFISGSLGTPQAAVILPAVMAVIAEYTQRGEKIIYTRDTHTDDYPTTQEGRLLPVKHCIAGGWGHSIADGIYISGSDIIDKPSFGSYELAELAVSGTYDEIELCGLCTDICVVSNALILKARLPETKITVDARRCAGVTEESHRAALFTMKMCQIIITNEQ
jgi:nicotinamidase-related amidase